MTELMNITGLYGKIPSLGDFISRRLTACFIETWDNWLQNGLSASKNQLGANWRACYLTSPIWYFLLSPNICGKATWVGLLMPSVDKVGRYFPLTLAAPIHPTDRLAELFLNSADWFEKIEHLALQTLDDEIDAIELDKRLLSHPFPESSIIRSKNPLTTFVKEENGFCLWASLDSLEQIHNAFAQMGFRLLSEKHFTYSLWLTTDADSKKTWIRVFHYLPPQDDFSKLFAWPKDTIENGFSTGESRPLDYPETPVQSHRSSIQTSASCSQIQWRSFGTTTIGCYRKINQDAFLERPEIGLWGVADGMGGHSAGEKASKAAVDALGKLVATGNLDSFIAYTTQCLRTVNDDLLRLAHRAGEEKIIGTTVVVLLAVGDRCAVIWAGDSRLYQIRDNVMTQMTIDHSMVAELSLQDDPLVRKEARKEIENVITRALGADPEIDLDVATFQAKLGDIYLLCSDGLVKEVSDDEIEAILNSEAYQTSGKRLVEMALARGARDNVTVVTAYADRIVV